MTREVFHPILQVAERKRFPPGVSPTLRSRWLRSVNAGLAVVCMLDLILGGAWLYVAHGTHPAQPLTIAIIAAIAILALCAWLILDEQIDDPSAATEQPP